MNWSPYLKEIVDLHVHANPDQSMMEELAGDDIDPKAVKSAYIGRTRKFEEVIDQCHEAGMLGVVYKNHGWPHPNAARILNERYDDFYVIPTCALNVTAGGCRPWVMEMANQMGCRMVWLPTWSSIMEKNNKYGWIPEVAAKYNPMLKSLRDDEFIYLLDDKGELTEDTKEVIRLARDDDIVLGTGHISTKEVMAVARFAHEINFHKLNWTHPTSMIDKFTDEQLVEFASLGGTVELCMINLVPLFMTTTAQRFAEIIRLVGADKITVGTDHFFDHQPSIPQQFKTFFEVMYNLGIPKADLI